MATRKDEEAGTGGQAQREEGPEGRSQPEDDRAPPRGYQDRAGHARRGRGPAQAHRRYLSQDPCRALRDRAATRSALPVENGPRRTRQETRRGLASDCLLLRLSQPLPAGGPDLPPAGCCPRLDRHASRLLAVFVVTAAGTLGHREHRGGISRPVGNNLPDSGSRPDPGHGLRHPAHPGPPSASHSAQARRDPPGYARYRQRPAHPRARLRRRTARHRQPASVHPPGRARQ